MPDWDIQPGGVQGVLAATEGVAAEFDPEMATLRSGLEGAVAQCSSEPVSAALVELAAAQGRNTEFVFTRTGACLNGAAQATNAYIAGDEQMAANAQAAASSAPDPTATMPGGGAR